MRYIFCFMTLAVISAFSVIPAAASELLYTDYRAGNIGTPKAQNQHFQTIQDRRSRMDKNDLEKRRHQLREELKSLPPEERRARMQELREKFKNKQGDITEERRQQFRERWQNASSEEKQRFCRNVQARCEQGHSPACRIAQKACSSF